MLQECMNFKPNKNAKHPYSDGLRLGDYVWISGQLPIDPETGRMVGDAISCQTEQAMKNVCAVLSNYQLCVEHLCRVTIYTTDLSQLDKINEVYASFFEDVFPTRSVVGAAELPNDALIEIEAYALDTRALEVLCDEAEEDDALSCNCENGVCG